MAAMAMNVDLNFMDDPSCRPSTRRMKSRSANPARRGVRIAFPPPRSYISDQSGIFMV
jgi:hypothetical protein